MAKQITKLAQRNWWWVLSLCFVALGILILVHDPILGQAPPAPTCSGLPAPTIAPGWTCCNGVWTNTNSTTNTGCCNGQVFNTGRQQCCKGSVIARINRFDCPQVTCSGLPRPTTAPGWTCCNGVWTNTNSPTNTGCCNGQVF